MTVNLCVGVSLGRMVFTLVLCSSPELDAAQATANER